MKRRQFLQGTLSLGAVTLLPGVNLANTWIGDTPPLKESALLTTGKVNPTWTVHNIVRKFMSIDNDGNYKFPRSNPPEGTPPVWIAAVDGDWDSLKWYLDHDPSLMTVTGDASIGTHYRLGRRRRYRYEMYDNLPLIHVIATWSDNGEALRYLTSLGADVNTPYKYGTPLHFAARYGDRKVVEYLISKGAKGGTK